MIPITTARPKAGHLIALLAAGTVLFGATGCSDNQKRQEAQNLVKSGTDVSDRLAQKYDELGQQSQKMPDLLIMQSTLEAGTGDAAFHEDQSYFIDAGFDIPDKPGLIARLQQRPDLSAAYVYNHLASPTKPLIDAYKPGGDDRTVSAALEADFRVIIQGDDLYRDKTVRKSCQDMEAAADKARDEQQQKVDALRKKFAVSRDKQEQKSIQDQIDKELKMLAPLTELAARYEIVSQDVDDATFNDFSGNNASFSRLPSPIKERTNRLILTNIFRGSDVRRSYLRPIDYEEHQAEQLAMQSRAGLARALKVMFAAAGNLIDYDARGEVKTAAGKLQTQIEAVNHHPLKLGAGIPANIFQGLAGDIARHDQVRQFLKDTPAMMLVVQNIRESFHNEEGDCFDIEKGYNHSVYLVCRDLITKKQINTLSGLQPQLDLFAMQLVTQTAGDETTLEYAKARAYDVSQANLRKAKTSLTTLDSDLESLVQKADHLLHGNARQQASAPAGTAPSAAQTPVLTAR